LVYAFDIIFHFVLINSTVELFRTMMINLNSCGSLVSLEFGVMKAQIPWVRRARIFFSPAPNQQSVSSFDDRFKIKEWLKKRLSEQWPATEV
jgi:hypothetical protein